MVGGGQPTVGLITLAVLAPSCSREALLAYLRLEEPVKSPPASSARATTLSSS